VKHLDVQLAHRLLRGELDAAARAHWQRHVDRCARCRELLASERGILTLLSMADEASGPAEPDRDLERFLRRVDAVRGGTVARRRRLVGLAGGFVLCTLLLGLLVSQLRQDSAQPERSARALGISLELQDQVASDLGALEVLERDPWIADQYEAVCTLELLIVGTPDP